MAQQNYYTLEEAADKLGLKVSDFKRRLRTEWTHIRPLQDGNTQRFKSKDVEELARQIGFGSEEELQLVDPASSDEISIPLELDLAADDAPKPSSSASGKIKSPSGKTKAPSGKAPPTSKSLPPVEDNPLILGDQDVFLLADDDAPAKSPSKKSKPPKADSDVRLQKSGKIFPAASGDTGSSEEIELDILPKAGSSTKLSGPSGKMSSTSSGKLSSTSSSKLGSKSGKLPSVPESDSSEFELTLDSDSDEFELSLSTDSSDEISLDIPPVPEGGKAGASGINIGKPADTGVSLEGGSGIIKLASDSAISKKSGDSTKKKPGESGIGGKSGKMPKPDTGSDEEIDFELSLDQGGGKSAKKLGSGKNLLPDSDSEFDLSLDDADMNASLDGETAAFSTAEEPKNDIFETDFEIPALDDDSASEAVAIDEADTDLESSDFDLAIDESSDVSVEDESASQVVVLDDETDDEPVKPKKKTTAKPKTKKLKPVEEDDSDVEIAEDGVSFDDMELDESVSASKALEGVKGEEEGEEEVEGRTVVVSGAPWGPLPALLLLPTVFIVFLGGLMAFEMMHSMWGYHQPTKPASMIIDGVAQTLDMKPKE